MTISDMKAVLNGYLIMNGYNPTGAAYMIGNELQMDARDEFGTFKMFRISPKDVISTFVIAKRDWVTI